MNTIDRYGVISLKRITTEKFALFSTVVNGMAGCK